MFTAEHTAEQARVRVGKCIRRSVCEEFSGCVKTKHSLTSLATDHRISTPARTSSALEPASGHSLFYGYKVGLHGGGGVIFEVTRLGNLATVIIYRN